MKIQFKKRTVNAKAPEKAHSSDAGFDLFASSVTYPQGSVGVFVEINTGISVDIPKGYVGLVFPRSSITNTKHFLRNSVGVIDSGYLGDIKLRFSIDETSTQYKVGDKVGQIVFIKLPSIELVETNHLASLASSERGESGFGSTGK